MQLRTRVAVVAAVTAGHVGTSLALGSDTEASRLVQQVHDQSVKEAAAAASTPLQELLSRCRQSPLEQTRSPIPPSIDTDGLNLYYQVGMSRCGADIPALCCIVPSACVGLIQLVYLLQEIVPTCKTLLPDGQSTNRHAEETQQRLEEVVGYAGQVHDPTHSVYLLHTCTATAVPACACLCFATKARTWSVARHALITLLLLGMS